MKRIVTLSLLAIACLTMQAQSTWYQAKPMKAQTKKQDVKFLAKCDAYFMAAVPEATIDKKTKKKTVVWKDTENNSWHENMGFVKNVPTIDSLGSLFPNFTNREDYAYLPVLWQLTEENDETVLHC